MKRKIYKVYAQCCIAARATEEITLEKALELIDDTVNDMVNMGDLTIEAESDDEFADAFGELVTKAEEFFKTNGYFECGDFIIKYSEEYPTRSGSYGWTRDFE